MSRRNKRGRPINGWVVLDKPARLTSTHAVAKVKRLFDAQKAGHAGTLDPLATGVLPIALGEATKTVSFAVDGPKSYRFSVRWGAETDTDDAEGTVTRTSERRPTLPEIEAVLPQFVGEISQVPPQFSAIKIEGQRAYDLARGGETLNLEPRIVVIERLSIADMPDDATTVFEADCGKGTYVRAIARDIGRTLGCYGHVVQLRRTRVGAFDEDLAWTFQEIEAALARPEGAEVGVGGSEAETPLLACQSVLSDLAEVVVASGDASRLQRGQSVLIRGRDAPILNGPFYAICRGRLVALGEAEGGELRPTRVFNLG